MYNGFLKKLVFGLAFVGTAAFADSCFSVKDNKIVPQKYVVKGLDLVDLAQLNPHIKLDIRYATSNNFVGRPFYHSLAIDHCYLRTKPAMALNEAQKELETIGLGLKIFDAFRPFCAQRLLFEIFPNPTYVIPPDRERARHPRGTTVDLTLVDKDGKELPMPTEYDSSSPQAAHFYSNGLSQEVINNREALLSVMTKYGFCALGTEWWHYDFYDWKSYEVIDLDFPEIVKILESEQK